MPLIKIQDMLKHARRNTYAIGAFELRDLNYLKPILDTSERTQSPVILNLTESAVTRADLEWMMPAIQSAAKRSTAPVAIQFSGGSSVDSAILAINLGCGGVLLDASTELSCGHMDSMMTLVASAHGCDTAVEGLLGPSDFAAPGRALDYTRETEVDSLATNIESAADIGRLFDLSLGIDVPLAVYLSAELEDEDYKRLIAMGVSKIYCGTALTDAANRRLSMEATASTNLTIGSMVTTTQKAIGAEVERRQTLWGSTGRAQQLLTESRPCAEVEHLIIFNVDQTADEMAVSAMMADGRKTLSAIPGVRRVFTGQSVREDAAYRYCWLVRFSDEAVIDSYRDHPDHVNFADTLFRPIAGDRISIDYETVE